MGFTKLDSGLTRSSIWFEPWNVKIVWISMLSLCDSNGFVSTSRVGLQHSSQVFGNDFEEAIAILEGPDPDSKDSSNDGRRIEKVEGGWKVLNYMKYRERIYSENKEAVRKREYRKKSERDIDGTYVPKTVGHSASAYASSSSSLKEEECEKEITKEKKEKPLWKTNFGEYELQAGQAFDRLVADQEFLRLRKKYHPNLDIRLSMEKAFNDFWGQECGWKHKKAQRADEIDWERTYANALTMKGNQVYEKRD